MITNAVLRSQDLTSKQDVMPETSLSQQLKACLRGEIAAQRALYDAHNRRLFGICLRYARDRHEAQDMLQEAFIYIFRDLGQYQFNGAFEGWLRKVTVRAVLQYLRRKNPLRFAEDYDALPAAAFEVQPDQEFKQETILKMVQVLPEGYRTVFNLHCLEAWTYEEIAQALNINESSVRSQYARACKQLRKLLEETLAP